MSDKPAERTDEGFKRVSYTEWGGVQFDEPSVGEVIEWLKAKHGDGAIGVVLAALGVDPTEMARVAVKRLFETDKPITVGELLRQAVEVSDE